MSYISILMGYILSFCYSIGKNYMAAVLLLTLFSKILLLPVSLWTQKNSIKMVKMQPELNRIQINFFGDKDKIADETTALYKQEKYNPFAGIFPLLIQIIILLGIIEVVKYPGYANLSNTDMTVGNIAFYASPYLIGGWYWCMPFLAGISALILGFAQNYMNPLQSEQSKAGKLGTMLLSTGISLALGAFVPAGVGYYWICSNLLTILQQLFLNTIINPHKYIDREALTESRKQLDELQNIGAKKKGSIRNPYAAREKADYKRFFSVANKHLVFYSEKNGFYKYYENVIDYLLEHSNLVIHYITSDPNDHIFEKAEKNNRFRGYYIGEKRLITLMMKMDADIVVMTMPDLENYHIKRSYVKSDIEYIYMFHWCTSTHMVIREKALDHYDTIFCPGPHQIAEIQYTEKTYGLPPKNLIETSYGVIENLVEAYQKMEKKDRKKPQILIAPSYQTGNIMESCIDDLLGQFLELNYKLIVRPHPQYIRRVPQKIDAFAQKYHKELEQGLFEFQTDISSGDTVYQSDIVITDWSTISYEFSFTTLRPTLFINTPMKVMNPHYVDYPMEPLDITLRDQIGQSLNLDETGRARVVIGEMLDSGKQYQEQILNIREDLMPKFGESAEIGGKYILAQLVRKKQMKQKLKNEN